MWHSERKESFIPWLCVTASSNKAMAYTWTVVVAGISFLVYFTKLPFSVVPVLLFGAFLASGGKSFPRIFFRTFFRDLRYGTSVIKTLSLPLYLFNNGSI